MVLQGQSTEISRLEARNLLLWAGYDETRSYTSECYSRPIDPTPHHGRHSILAYSYIAVKGLLGQACY